MSASKNELHLTSIPLSHELRKLPGPLRLVLGLIICGFLGFCIPLVVVMATGHWTNRLMVLVDVGFNVLFLVVVSLVGYFCRHIIATAGVVAAAFLTYMLQHYLRYPGPVDWSETWPEIALPVVALMLNAFLFARYVKGSELRETAV